MKIERGMHNGGWKTRALKVVSSPVYATVTTVLAVVAGLLGSVYQDDIARSFPLTLSGPWQFVSGRPLAFWVSVVVFAIMFFLRQRLDDRNRERLSETTLRAEQGTARVEALVRTMPPRAFQTQLAQLVAAAYSGMAKTLPRSRRSGLTDDDLRGFIRSLLNSIARLALIYDDQPIGPDGPVTYAANIMLFVPTPAGGSWPSALKDSLRFCDPNMDLGQLLGVLRLVPDLSATSDVAELPPADGSVPGIALPVPKEAKKDGRWLVLPGAPKAFLTDAVDGYDDATTLAEWCETSGDFRPSVVQQVRHYFRDGDGRAIRSFISRPLHAGDGRTIGVVNIHSNQIDILGSVDERMPTFQAMLTPLFLELQTALELVTVIDPEVASSSGRPYADEG